MVGDNVNDTAALLVANVTISFNDANAIASDAADVVVAGNGLEAIADAAGLARKTAVIASTGVVAGMATSLVLMLAGHRGRAVAGRGRHGTERVGWPCPRERLHDPHRQQIIDQVSHPYL